MNKSDKIISRVRKLLAMAADGSSPNEAMMAAKRARILMDKHQISQKDLVESDGFNESLVGKSRKFMAKWEQNIAVNIAKYNDCIVSFNLQGDGFKKLVFKGFESDVTVARYMFGYLVDNGKRLCSKFMKEEGFTRYNASIGTTFKNNYGYAITGKLQEIIKERQNEFAKSTGTDLIIVKKELVEKKFGVASYKSSRDKYQGGEDHSKARAGGIEAGKNTNITTGVGGTVDKARLN